MRYLRGVRSGFRAQASVVLLAAMLRVPAVSAQQAPIADHHQHLFSPALVAMLGAGGGDAPPVLTARDLIPLLDSAHIQRAVLLSVAYMYGSPRRTVEDEYARVRAENDWTAGQAAAYPHRLIAFCGFNPLKDYALDELARCARTPGLDRGIKLHLGNSDVQLENPEHIERLRQVFRAANQHHMAIVVHMRASISRKRPYGPAQARAFLEQLLPEAPDVPVQVAHLAGTGPGYDDPPADSVMAFLAEAAYRKDPRTRHLWFDVAGIMDSSVTAAQATRMVQRIRRVGVERILYGSDAAVVESRRPREGWAEFRRLPLKQEEFARIARNAPPYFR
jgi:uncharacterized protein